MKKQFQFNPQLNSANRDAITIAVRKAGFSSYMEAGFGGDRLITSATMSQVIFCAKEVIPAISFPCPLVYQDY